MVGMPEVLQQESVSSVPGHGDQLTEHEAAVLAFEKGWTGGAAAKSVEVKQRFDLSTAAYHQQLNRLLDRRAALAAEPLLVKRLRRLREQRQAERSSARLPRRAR